MYVDMLEALLRKCGAAGLGGGARSRPAAGPPPVLAAWPPGHFSYLLRRYSRLLEPKVVRRGLWLPRLLLSPGAEGLVCSAHL